MNQDQITVATICMLKLLLVFFLALMISNSEGSIVTLFMWLQGFFACDCTLSIAEFRKMNEYYKKQKQDL